MQGDPGATGPAGPQGDPGLQGAAGPASSTIVTGTTQQSAPNALKGKTVTATATCSSGVLMGGGGVAMLSDGSSPFKGVLTQSYPSTASTWTVVGVVEDANLNGSRRLNVTAYAVCSG
jgi:hypothetical protein